MLPQHIGKREEPVFALSFEGLEPTETCLFEGLNDGHELAVVGVVVVAAEEGVGALALGGRQRVKLVLAENFDFAHYGGELCLVGRVALKDLTLIMRRQPPAVQLLREVEPRDLHPHGP